MSALDSICAMLDARKVDRVRTHKVGTASLAVDRHDTVERKLVTVEVKALVADAQDRAAVAVVRILAGCDKVDVCQRYALKDTAAKLAQAKAGHALQEVLLANKLNCNRDGLLTLQAAMLNRVADGIKNRRIPSRAIGVDAPGILLDCERVDLDRLLAAMPQAAALVEANAKAEAAKKAKKDAQAAALAKPIAKAPAKSLSAMAGGTQLAWQTLAWVA